MARVYAGWGLSQAWYREELYKQLGHPSVEDFLVYFWENFFLQCDANNLLAQAKTWQDHNVGDSPGFDGDWRKALATVSAKAMILPGQTDLYFPPKTARPRQTACRTPCIGNPVHLGTFWRELACIRRITFLLTRRFRSVWRRRTDLTVRRQEHTTGKSLLLLTSQQFHQRGDHADGDDHHRAEADRQP